MHLLTEKEFECNAHPMMQEVFWKDREWGLLFNEKIDSKRILFPLYFYASDEFPKKLLEALTEAAIFLDDACYLSELPINSSSKHAYIPLSELLEGFTAPPMSKRLIGATLDIDYQDYFTIYSEHGKWGIFHSFEHFGFLGGSSDFMHMIESKIPNMEDQTYEFIRWIKGENTSKELVFKSRPRVQHLLKHMYGSLKTEKLLQETGWY